MGETLAPAPTGTLKMREWKMREQIAGVENVEVENAGVNQGQLSRPSLRGR